MGIHARRRAVAAAALAGVAIVAIVLATSGGGAAAPPDEAARLVPAGTLAYVRVATDVGRDGVRRALALAGRFPAFRSLRAGLVARLTAPGCGLGRAGLHGREAAVAITPAGTLTLLDTGSASGAAAAHACGSVTAERIGRFLAVGAPAAVNAARAVAAGRAQSLAGLDAYRRVRTGLPGGRFADAYLSAAGLRTVLAPRGGLAGMAAAVLDRPDLVALGLAAEARAPGVRLTIDELGAAQRAPSLHAPQLADRIPAGAVAALDVADLGAALRRFGGLLGGMSTTVQRQLAAALPGETALWLTPHGTDSPTLTMINGGAQAGRVPAALGAGALHAAVLGGHLVVSTRPSGLDAARHSGARLRDSAAYRAVLADAPARLSALGFLDFSELLRLGEQTGLDASRAYRRVRDDLRKVRAVGAVSTGDADHTTVQLELSIP
ncbi:MAG: hypothetical protein QOF12_1230 [Solirubrobacteraceae bacterium]|nr:hypothetical protein [Solirubrobacteraceae bacterium]